MILDNIVRGVHGLLMDNLPAGVRANPSGWFLTNCPMCSDRRKRGGVKLSGTGIGYNCFNCGFSTRWEPGQPLSQRYRDLATALGANERDINRLVITLMQFREELEQHHVAAPVFDSVIRLPDFDEKPLLDSAKLVTDLAEDHPVRNYAEKRGIFGLTPLLWFNEPAWRQRLVIPFLHNQRIVGWTGRHVKDDTDAPKYLLDKPPGFVYNLDSFVNTPRQLVVVVEGVVDAIQIDGVALLTNNINPIQAELINNLGKRVILCPDRDRPGKVLIDQAIEHDWHVSFPPWEAGIKDASDAVARYGRSLTLASIIEHATGNKTKIEVLKKLR
jgi:hypothetical protein